MSSQNSARERARRHAPVEALRLSVAAAAKRPEKHGRQVIVTNSSPLAAGKKIYGCHKFVGSP
jgi:hypothetical protein